jgi:hypothetical protein
MLEAAYREFLSVRLTADWDKTEVPSLRAWLKDSIVADSVTAE